MGILLLLLGLLTAVSGGLKLRTRIREQAGVSPLTFLEIGAGGCTVLWSGAGLGRVRPVAWTVVVAVAVLMVLSTAVHVRRMAAWHRRRRESEAQRLWQHLGR